MCVKSKHGCWEKRRRRGNSSKWGWPEQAVNYSSKVYWKTGVRRRESRGKQRGVEGEWQSSGTIGEGDNGTGKQHVKQ